MSAQQDRPDENDINFKHTAMFVEQHEGSTPTELSRASSEDVLPLNDIPRWRRCLGLATVTILVVTIPLNVAILGFLAFLWYAGPSNTFWHAIIIRGWATRAVTVPSLLLRSFADVQAGAATAMIAALVLECSSIPVRDAARWSIARAAKSRPRNLFIPIFRKPSPSTCVAKTALQAAIVLLCGTITTLQLASTILLTDFGLDPLPGMEHENEVSYNVNYPTLGGGYVDPSGWYVDRLDQDGFPLSSTRLPTWRRNPPAYPTFAEYREPAEPDPQGLIDDTGVLLRAFLPYADAASRESLGNYTGKTLVLDSRVSCQAPAISHLTASSVFVTAAVQNGNTYSNPFTSMEMHGEVSPTERTADRLWSPQGAIPFDCVAGIGGDARSFCQLAAPFSTPSYCQGGAGPVLTWNRAGGLLSEFSNLTSPQELSKLQHSNYNAGGAFGDCPVPAFITWGTSLLVLETVETGSLQLLPNFSNPDEGQLHPKVSQSQEGPWTIIKSDYSWHPWTIRASLCYTAWDTAALDVDMDGSLNRTEPAVHWHTDGTFYTVPNATQQLIPNFLTETDVDFEDRQILRLKEKDSWIPLPEDAGEVAAMPFVQAYGDMSGLSAATQSYMQGNWSTILTKDYLAKWLYMNMGSKAWNSHYIMADDTLVYLFDDFMKSSGSIAQSVSALITVLSGMAYYDQLPRFEKRSNVSEVFFTDALYPQRVCGFWGIVVVVLLHTLLIVLVTAAFSLKARLSYVGNYWHAAVQLFSEDTRDIFAHGSAQTDREIRDHVVDELGPGLTATLAVNEDEKSAYIKVKGIVREDSLEKGKRNRDENKDDAVPLKSDHVLLPKLD